MLGIVPFGLLFGDQCQFGSDKLEALVLQTGYDTADQSTLHAVRFDHQKRLFHGYTLHFQMR
ncbi:hypothetical protein D3C73_1554130 [compost metagenome]